MFEPSESFLLLQVVRRGGLGRKALPVQANSSHGATARKGHEEKLYQKFWPFLNHFSHFFAFALQSIWNHPPYSSYICSLTDCLKHELTGSRRLARRSSESCWNHQCENPSCQLDRSKLHKTDLHPIFFSVAIGQKSKFANLEYCNFLRVDVSHAG